MFSSSRWLQVLLVGLMLVSLSEVCRADGFVVRPAAPGGQVLDRAPAAVPQRATAKDEERRWLLAVGIRRFVDTRIAPLTYCVADAQAFADYFRADGVPAERITLMLDEDAGKDALIAALHRLSESLDAADSLFVFYSSHGAGDAEGTTYFITFDTVIDDLKGTALPMQSLKNEVEKIKCRNLVMMFDTCHSGGAKALGRPHEKAYDNLLRSADRATRVAILSSSRSHETSLEAEAYKHGVFTYFMLEGLAGASDNFPRDGRVSVTELFDYVMVAVPRATDRAQHPSEKFSYNWPRAKEDTVRFGRVKDGLVPSGPAAKAAGGADPAALKPDAGSWRPLLNER